MNSFIYFNLGMIEILHNVELSKKEKMSLKFFDPSKANSIKAILTPMGKK
jgi:hypothetical protein